MGVIVLLDDDAQLRRLLVAALGARGHTVLEAESGAAATEIVDGTDVDLVVVDGLLPDVTGTTWIERLRASGRTTSVVFLSAFWRDTSTYEHLTRDLGVGLVLYKPIDPEAFADRVEASFGASLAPAPQTAALAVFEQELVALKAEYAVRLPMRIDEVAETVRIARENIKNLDDAILRSHRLRGTAASYGFPEVGAAMAVVEDALVDMQRSGLVNRGVWEEIHRSISDARIASSRGASTRVSIAPSVGVPGERVLVVDDDPEFLSIVARMARRVMVDVVPARTASEALDKARATRVSAAIIDVRLGAAKAFDFARTLRETDGYADLPLAFVSVDSSMAHRVLAAHAGASLFLEKPLTEDKLDRAIEQLLRSSAPQRPRVLIVEDDPDFVAVVRGILEADGIVVEAIADPGGVLHVLDEFRPDLLLLDVVLPGVGGFDVCRALRTSQHWHSLPIVLVTARSDPAWRVEAFRAGGSDFLEKPIVAEELLARVRVRLEQARTQRERAERDSLSGLMLRRPFLEALSQRLAESKRYTRPLTFGLLDLDLFKSVNDTHGHSVGDQVIAAFGHLLRERFRVEDLRGRWGGEEFVVAFPGSAVQVIAKVVERLLVELSAIDFRSDSGARFRVTFTAGLAGYPDDGSSQAALIRRADERLYTGKHAGRARVVASD